MAEPTTPTGKRLWGEDVPAVAGRAVGWLAGTRADILAIEAEAASRLYHDSSDETGELCRRCAAWHDEEEAAWMTWRTVGRTLAAYEEARK